MKIFIIILILCFVLISGCTESQKDGFAKADCSNDCVKLDKEIFKYDYSMGGYSANTIECWCKDKLNNVSQVW